MLHLFLQFQILAVTDSFSFFFVSECLVSLDYEDLLRLDGVGGFDTSNGLSSSQIQRFPKHVVSESNAQKQICAICLEKVDRSTACTLPCSHTFHASCLEKLQKFNRDRWGGEDKVPWNSCCPTCRAKMPSDCGNADAKAGEGSAGGSDLASLSACIEKLEESGPTALGPALLCAACADSRRLSSTWIDAAYSPALTAAELTACLPALLCSVFLCVRSLQRHHAGRSCDSCYMLAQSAPLHQVQLRR